MAHNNEENEDVDNTDNESINIDDIFNENLFYEKWSNTPNYSLNHIDNSSLVNTNSVALIPNYCNRSTPQFSNDYIPNRRLFDYERYNYNNYFINYDGSVANNCWVNSDYPLLYDNQIPQFGFNRRYPHLAKALTTIKRIPRHLNIPNITCGNENDKQQRCYVCNDYAVGRHYGVVTCEGCKGFFKRTIKYNHVYNCRENNNCVVDKEFRKRCQACRFQKCLAVGMKREAVQSISTSLKKPRYEEVADIYLPEDPLTLNDDICQVIDINWEDMLRIEMEYNPDVEVTGIMGRNAMELISGVFNEHLFSIVTWAKQIPGFGMLPISDQKLLLRMGWGELVIANLTHRSLKLQDDVILFRNGSKLMPEMAQQSGLGRLIDRIIFEILHQFRDLKVDRCELSYIKAIILFNPNLKDLEHCVFVQTMRDMLCCSLQKYCLEHYPTERYRFNKLLLRLPTLRSIAHITVDHFRLHDSLRQNVSKVQIYQDGNNDRHSGPNWYGQHQFKFLCEMLSYADIILDH